MAEGVTSGSGDEREPGAGRELEQTARELAPGRSQELARYTPPLSHGHEHRFRLAFAGLAGLGLAAVIAAGIFLIGGRPPKPPAWSQWKPSASGDAALSQIANHVAPAYRLPTGEQLVAVDGGPLQFAGIPVKIVLLRTPSEFALPDGKGALYTLCGLGPHCSIKVGKPSQERTLLLRRESLELALYTFRYVGDVKQVVVLLPPAPKHTASQAMFFRRDDVKPQLERPLRYTLPGKPPSIPSLRSGPTHDLIDRMTIAEVYNFDFTQAPDASVLLELAHFKLQSDTSAGAGASTPGTP
jgi:hypothetical protein